MDTQSCSKLTFTFLRFSLIRNLYWEIQPGGLKLTDEEVGYIFYENKLQGVARLRQVRVKRNSCTVSEDFKNLIKSCYGVYHETTESKEPYGDDNIQFTYRSAADLGGSSHTGIISRYSGGGYVQDLTTRSLSSEALIERLFAGSWIDRGTRAVFIDFTVYNANVNLFCVVRLLGEFPATGGVITSSNFYTVKLLRYKSASDKIIMALEIIICLFILYYIFEEIAEIFYLKVKYFKRFWNYIDLAIIIIAICCLAFNVYRTMTVSSMLTGLLKDPNQYPDFEHLAYWQVVFNSALAFLVFFAWVKLFKYLSFNKTMYQLSATLSRCSSDLLGFAIMFFVIFLAFAQLGYLLFGTQAKGFSTFSDSVFTLFRIILGDFNFAALEEANRVLGPIYFILYVFFIFFILINMFLAIITDTYSDVKTGLATNRDARLLDYISRRFNDLLISLHLKADKSSVEKKIRDCSEWEKEMIDYGFAKEHVAMVMDKYCQNNEILTIAQQEQMTKALEEMSKGYFDADGEKQLPSVEVRMENMQQNFASLVDKIDDVILRFRRSELQKAQRMAAMTKLLDAIVEAQNSSDERKVKQIQTMVREELSRMET